MKVDRLSPLAVGVMEGSFARRAWLFRGTIVALSLFLGACTPKPFITTSACANAALSPQTLGCQVVTIDKKVFETADRLKITLPQGGSVIITRTALVKRGTDAFIWRGKLGGAGYSNATFSVVRDAVVGKLVTPDGSMYRLRKTPQGSMVFERLNSKAYRVRDNTLKPPPRDLKSASWIIEPSPDVTIGRVLSAHSFDSAPSDRNERLPDINAMPEPFETVPAKPYLQFAALRQVTTANAAPPACGGGNPDSPDQIDVMVLYTHAAVTEAGSKDDMIAWINAAEDETNVSYSDSGVFLHVNVLQSWIGEVLSYVEKGLSPDLIALKNPSDGKMDEVHGSRKDAGADIVVLITHMASFGAGGLADTLQPSEVGNQLFEPRAFAVVEQEHFSAPAYIFAHELGHLMGAQHDEQSSPGRTGAFPFSHGHVEATPVGLCTDPWMTIMSEDPCCTPNGYWSSPKAADACGRPMGAAATEDNGTTLKKTACTVANFRLNVQTSGPNSAQGSAQ